MPVFEYSGLDSARRATKGIIDADSAKAARVRLRKQGVFPTEVTQQAQGGLRGRGLNVEIDLSQYFQLISPRDVAQITTQLSTLVGANVPMVEALTALVDQTEKSRLKVILSQVKERVNEGTTLAEALGAHPKVFDTLFVQMVRAGEKSGALDEVLSRLAKYTEASVKLQGKVASAMIYPILMSMIGVLILAGLFIGVIPRLRDMFHDLPGGEASLPLISKILFFVGDLMVGNPPTVLGFIFRMFVLGISVISVVYGFRRYVATESGRQRFDRFKLRAPVFGKLNKQVAVSRFCRTFGTLLVSGVPILSALDISQAVVGNAVLAKAIKAAAANIQEGQSIAVPLKASGEFPPLVTHMIAIGEKTGDLEPMLNKVANAYDDEVENTLETMTSLLGPIAILCMGGIVFVVALALLLPMMTMRNQIQ